MCYPNGLRSTAHRSPIIGGKFGEYVYRPLDRQHAILS